MKEIPLTKGYVALVDDADYDRVKAFKWHARVWLRKDGSKRIYAATGRAPVIYLHQLIMDAKRADHRNRDGLDNRRANLRLATQSLNCANSPTARGASGYLGVKQHTYSKGFFARIGVNYQRFHLGTFTTAEEAALAYDRAARHYFGEFATLNFPDQDETSSLCASEPMHGAAGCQFPISREEF
jgi:hypothetical protein